MSSCRVCPASIVWAVTVNGKAIPVDAEPSPDGNVRLTARPGQAPLTMKKEDTMNEMKVARCDAVVLMGDDGLTLQCESGPDHKPPHSHAMTACEPAAELTWWTE